MSRVLLISPEQNWRVQREMHPSNALILLGTILQNHGHEAKVVHMIADLIGLSELRQILQDYQPDIVGLTVTTYQTRSTKEVSRVIKKCSNALVVAGGPHPSAIYPSVEKDFPDIDGFVNGEGEEIILKIAEGRIDTLSSPAPIKDLDGVIPLPNLNLVDITKFKGTNPPNKLPRAVVMGSRGCPFNCSFCDKSVFGRTVRYRSPDAVFEEVRQLYVNWGIREVFFEDDNFNLNRKWAEEVLTNIIRARLNKKMAFKVSFRANEELVDEDLLKLAKEAGVWLIFYGVESGNQDMLDSMNKGLALDEIYRAFKLTRKAGIKTVASFIVGLPGETEQTVRDSIGFWRRIKPFWTGFSRAAPFPGTRLEQTVKGKGHLRPDSYDEYTPMKTLVRTDELNYEQLEEWARKLDRLTYHDKLLTLAGKPGMARKMVFR